MFSMKLGSVQSAKNSALSIFNDALNKLSQANEKAELFKKETNLRLDKLSKKVQLEHSALSSVEQEQKDIASITQKIKAIVGE